ncbi:MAG: hypothetical protein V2A34_12040 [Lentisphaerota bacterium]
MKKMLFCATLVGLLSLPVYSGSLGVGTQKFSHTVAQGVSIGADTALIFHVGGGFEQISFTVSDNAGWLAVTSDFPVCDEYIPAQAGMSYFTELLPAGTYTGRITFISTSTLPPTAVATTLVTITPASYVIGRAPALLDESMVMGSTNEFTRQIEIWNAGTGGSNLMYMLSESVPWLHLPVIAGASTGEHDRLDMIFTNLAGMSLGSYTAQVMIGSSGAVNQPQILTAVLTITGPPPTLELNTNQLAQTLGQGMTADDGSLNIINNGGSVLYYSITSTEPWLSVTPTNGANYGGADFVTAGFNPGSRAPGTYWGYLLISAPDISAVPESVSVTMVVTSCPEVIAASGGLCATATVVMGSAVSTMEVWNAGSGALYYDLTPQAGMMDPLWLSVEPSLGTSTTERVQHRVYMDASLLSPGEYTGRVAITGSLSAPPNSPYDVTVRLWIASALMSSPTSIVRGIMEGQTAASQVLNLRDDGGGGISIPYSISQQGNWFSLDITNGTLMGDTNQITLSFNTAGRAPGVYNGWIHIEGIFQTLEIPVSLTISNLFTVFEERIVFAVKYEDDYDLWTIKPDGAWLQPLVERAYDQTDPQVSPDGRRLLYLETAGSSARHYVLDLSTLQDTRLDGNWDALRWMPDSRGVYASKFEANRTLVYEVLLNGKTTPVFWDKDKISLMGADTSGQILYSQFAGLNGASRLRKYMPASRKMATLRTWEDSVKLEGRLSPNERRLCYRSVRIGGGKAPIIVSDLEGNRELRVTTITSNYYSSPSFSPDGSHIASIKSTLEGRCALRISDMSGTNEWTLYSPPADASLFGLCWKRMVLPNPVLWLNPTGYTDAVMVDDTNILERTFQIKNTGNAILEYVVRSQATNWLTVNRTTGSSTGETDTVSMYLNTATLNTGIHTGRVSIMANGTNKTRYVQVVLEVQPIPPILTVLQQLAAGSRTNSGAFMDAVTVWNSGGRTMSFTAGVDQVWMTLLDTSGSSTGDVNNLRLQFNSAGLAAGDYTGRVTVVAGNQTNLVLVTYRVSLESLLGPNVGVTPHALTNACARYQDAPDQTFAVSNVNPGLLHYYVDEQADWLQVLPTSSSNALKTSNGETDLFRVRYFTASKAQGVYNTNLYVRSSNGTETITVQLTVGPPQNFTVTVKTNGTGGGVSFSPVTSQYSHFSTVLLTATPTNPSYLFLRWEGPVADSSAASTWLNIRSNTTVTAVFSKYTCIQGTVLNARTLEVLKNAKLVFGGMVVTSGINGGYALTTSQTDIKYGVERVGYESTGLMYTNLPLGSAQILNFALEPEGVQNVRAYQRDWFKDVEIKYDLMGDPADRHTVAVKLSDDGGSTWDFSFSTSRLSGAFGPDQKPGNNKTIYWDAIGDAPCLVTPLMKVRLIAAGVTNDSSVFPLKSTLQDTVVFRCYADLNGNHRYDIGEELKDVEFYYGGRTVAYRVGLTDANGEVAYPGDVKGGDTFFARRVIFTRPAQKAHHDMVDDVLCKVWLDSDVGGRDDERWNGIWKTLTMIEEHVAAAARGEVIHVRLDHPVFEWNLTVYSKLTDAGQLSRIVQAMPFASKYLYRTTDGQMKLGKIYIRSTNVLNNYDYVFDPAAKICNANGSIGKVETAYGRVEMTVGAVEGPITNLARTIIHEAGHYMFNLYDEYRNVTERPGPWRGACETNGFPGFNGREVFPSNYGTMDNQGVANTWSSYNDYVLDFTRYIPPTWLPMFPETRRAADWLTVQAAMFDVYWLGTIRPCWQFLEDRYQKSYSNIPVEISAPLYGVFLGYNVPLLPDRAGTFSIKAPYNVCEIKLDGNDWATNKPFGASINEINDTCPPSMRLQVLWNGAPARGAEVLCRPAKGTPAIRRWGSTDATGHILVQDAKPGDLVEVFWHGIKGSIEADEELIANGAIHDLASGSRRDEQAHPLSTNSIGLVISGLLDHTNFTMQIRSSLPLAANPVVILYREDGSSNNIPTVPIHERTLFEALIEHNNEERATVQISCLASNGQTLQTLDDYSVFQVSFTNYVDQEISPWPDSFASDTIGLLYRANGPTILPSAGGIPTNQMAYGCLFILADGNELSDTNFAAYRMPFDEADVAGINQSSIKLFRWNPAGLAWIEKSCNLDLADRSVQSMLTNTGFYVLLADSTADVTPPATITNLLAITGPHAPLVDLYWTAVGDDGLTGTASVYEVAFSTAEFASTNWADATLIRLPQAPLSPGSSESVRIPAMAEDALYYFGIKAQDKAGNFSPSCVVVSVRSGIADADDDGVSDQFQATFEEVSNGAMDAGADTDNDGLTTDEEYFYETDPLSWDTDGDGMGDGYELEHGLNPQSTGDRDLDADGDGLSNKQEHDLNTDPDNTDSDGDGMTDDWEAEKGLDPLTDGRNDGAEQDPDSDTYVNFNEYIADTNPTNTESYISLWDLRRGVAGPGLTFWGSSRRIYTIDVTTNDFPWSWESLQGEFYGDGNPSMTITDPDNQPSRTYRLRVRKP